MISLLIFPFFAIAVGLVALGFPRLTLVVIGAIVVEQIARHGF